MFSWGWKTSAGVDHAFHTPWICFLGSNGEFSLGGSAEVTKASVMHNCFLRATFCGACRFVLLWWEHGLPSRDVSRTAVQRYCCWRFGSYLYSTETGRGSWPDGGSVVSTVVSSSTAGLCPVAGILIITVVNSDVDRVTQNQNDMLWVCLMIFRIV